ncbi:hypothetical protein PISMIDRAFT_20403 [Pisolithus microcarpus 441]|uniref:Uncharacterized protein n=1 Tax=Pisolithus microcarpus 441 TaxID=765257 RepID=A0A0C9XDT1_9AGAM|nr:hypothetical protein PISMIDRAFT_20403 [Pisolithus microcarpus 441]
MHYAGLLPPYSGGAMYSLNGDAVGVRVDLRTNQIVDLGGLLLHFPSRLLRLESEYTHII